MKIEGDYLIFSTGKREYANCGIIGLAPDLEITEGYDGGLFHWWQLTDKEFLHLTKDELIELAEYMIDQWGKFIEKIKETNP